MALEAIQTVTQAEARAKADREAAAVQAKQQLAEAQREARQLVDEARRKAQEEARAAGRELIFVASVLGTDADLQNVSVQRQKLADAGVLVCKTNHQAALLAGEIIRQKKERDE